MKTALLVILLIVLSGCASKCKDCLTLTPAQLFRAVEKGWQDGYVNGFEAGEDASDERRMRRL
jgi:hypothetical protein